MNAPCKDCERREVGCHSVCAEYKEYNEHRERVRELRHLDTILSSMTRSCYRTRQRYHQKYGREI
jgi:hypothetical protein